METMHHKMKSEWINRKSLPAGRFDREIQGNPVDRYSELLHPYLNGKNNVIKMIQS